MTAKEFNRCIRLIKKGDKSGMELLYNKYYQKMLLTAELEVNNRFIAEDIVSNVLISIFQNAKNYGYIAYPNAYMYRSVMYGVNNYLLRNEKYVYSEIIDTAYSANESNLDLKIDFKTAIDKLTDRHKIVFQLHYVYGLKIKEIAAELKISVSTVNRDLLVIRDELSKFERN